MSVKVLKYGTKIKTTIGNISALITAVCIRDNDSLSYEISYFHNGIATTCWLKPIELEVDNSGTPQKAGLVNYQDETAIDVNYQLTEH